MTRTQFETDIEAGELDKSKKTCVQRTDKSDNASDEQAVRIHPTLDDGQRWPKLDFFSTNGANAQVITSADSQEALNTD